MSKLNLKPRNVYARAKNSFNYGGIIKKNKGDNFEIDDDLAQKLIKLDLIEVQTKTFKKIKVKKDVTIDKATNDS